jgi:hypothetical protein
MHFGVEGNLVDWREDAYYRIAGYDAMDPFLISILSDCDLWMYISSTGGLTAGRIDADHALFPYETADKLHVSHSHTGPKTLIRFHRDDDVFLWQPFSDDGRMRYELERSIYKHELGCEIWFEEINLSLSLVFRYGWRPSDEFGWVRTAELINNGADKLPVEIMDGVQNLLPAGISKDLQDSFSCLTDAYKSSECDLETLLAVYRLTANIVDRPEASEALRATIAWQAGLQDAIPVLGSGHWRSFALGRELTSETRLKGQRGSYLLCTKLTLAPGESKSWYIVLDTPVDQKQVVGLKQRLAEEMRSVVNANISRGKTRLRRLLSAADAFQLTEEGLTTVHHVSNVLYNIARGGVLPDQYLVEREDLAGFLEVRNRPIASKHSTWLNELQERLSLGELHLRAEETGDTDLIRLCTEYLPIVFSRRHGDPSRPWNRFSIVMKKEDGSPLYAYQGNWRDIFQNWEALARSFPECLEPMIAKFVNASTMDGFNPYRITHQGIDWEVPDPDDPWSSIGYWGDHQVIYLLKLMEASHSYHPGRLETMLTQNRFCYADVPYDLKPYQEIAGDAQNTIDFNWGRQRVVDKRVNEIGNDGRLVHENGEILHVNLAEKLLVPILAKLSNLIPGGGIWMNTVRPEWNDANNALVGNGMSVVTACYLYRHLGFCVDLFESSGISSFEMSSRVVDWLKNINSTFDEHKNVRMDDTQRRRFMDRAGEAFSDYRSAVYSTGPGEKVAVSAEAIYSFLTVAKHLVGETVRENQRDDGLYHAYNILHLEDGSAGISRLPLMLEGQVAVLSSGLLSAEESVALLKALRASSLYREDQNSYVLYPVKDLPSYLEMNRAPESVLGTCPVLAGRLEAGDSRILVRDAGGQLRFHPDFRNADALKARLDDDIPEAEAEVILDTYEEVFNHKAFTGRSGTMYGYEGIGCIYWHMVAKLLVAVQEVFKRAVVSGEPDAIIDQLRERYYDIRAGLGFTKSPDKYGAFPLDPYSHTPGFAGARQPGMTGQVKEEILTRWGELGVHVLEGRIAFDPALLQKGEFLRDSSEFSYVDSSGETQSIPLDPGSLAFTFCQVPVIYADGDRPRITVISADGTESSIEGNALPRDVSAEVFERTGHIGKIVVYR